jgi:hypothetical protein
LAPGWRFGLDLVSMHSIFGTSGPPRHAHLIVDTEVQGGWWNLPGLLTSQCGTDMLPCLPMFHRASRVKKPSVREATTRVERKGQIVNKQYCLLQMGFKYPFLSLPQLYVDWWRQQAA